MGLFVLDTDILTLFEREHAIVAGHVAQHSPSEIAISVVTVEEQLSGWYTQLRQAKRPERLAWAYRCLPANVRFLRHVQILDYDEGAIGRYDELRRQGPQDGPANRGHGPAARWNRGDAQRC